VRPYQPGAGTGASRPPLDPDRDTEASTGNAVYWLEIHPQGDDETAFFEI
jgi:hypothetical protein